MVILPYFWEHGQRANYVSVPTLFVCHLTKYASTFPQRDDNIHNYKMFIFAYNETPPIVHTTCINQFFGYNMRNYQHLVVIHNFYQI